MVLVTMTVVGCRPDSEEEDPLPSTEESSSNVLEQYNAVGEFMVAKGTSGEYGETDTMRLEILDGGKANIVLNQVRFNEYMPVKTTLVLADLTVNYHNSQYTINATSIVPLFNGAPYTQYTVNDLDFAYDVSAKVMNYTCLFCGTRGDMTVEYEGKTIDY